MINNPKILPDVKIKVTIHGTQKYTGAIEKVYQSTSTMQRFHDEGLDLNLQEIRDEIVTNLAREVCIIPSYHQNGVVIINRDAFTNLYVEVVQVPD